MGVLEQIRAEIERRIAHARENPKSYWDAPSYIDAWREILSFLDTFEEQEPQGLDEAAWEAANTKVSVQTILLWGAHEDVYTKEQLIEMFKAGAEWMAGQGETFESVVLKDAGGYPYIPPIEMYDYENEKAKYNPGDKVIVQIRRKND